MGLAQRWRALIGGAVPEDLGRPLTLRILAYQIQAQRFGDLDTTSKRELSALYTRSKAPVHTVAKAATDPSCAGSTDSFPSKPRENAATLLRCARPGTLLTREYGGAIHRVMVLEEGASWNGRTYESLSKVAFAITGTRWNGPRFFGLRDKVKDDRHNSKTPSQIFGRGRALRVTRPSDRRPSS